jgi:hypothetical protein
MFDLAPDVGFRRSWYRWKACATLSLKVLDLRETELGLERYGSTNRGHRSVFGPSRAFFRSRFRLDRGKSWRSESCTSFLNVSSFLRTRACGSTRCELGRLCARTRHCRGENYEIFSIVLFHPSVFARMVDMVPDVGFLKVWALHRGELGFVRCGPANRGRWNVPHVRGSFSDWDSGLTGGALDDPKVAHCS